jgi:hypothetical protein
MFKLSIFINERIRQDATLREDSTDKNPMKRILYFEHSGGGFN